MPALGIVTRYFGGTLLGTGGLVKAYTESTQLVVNAVERGRRVEVHAAMLAISYNLLERGGWLRLYWCNKSSIDRIAYLKNLSYEKNVTFGYVILTAYNLNCTQ